MSAQLARLHWELQLAVSQQAISLSEAWTFQDLLSMTPINSEVELPEQLQPMMGRLSLFQAEPGNHLPA